MKRPARSPRRSFVVEALESRALMSASPTDSIFVRFSSTVTAARETAELRSVDASVVTAYPDGPELISLGRGISPASAIAKLEADPGVVYASPNSIIHVTSDNLATDPSFGQDWGLNNPNNVDIDAPEAWGVTLGSTSTIVAVIDTGIDLDNPDFVGRVWTNSRNDAKQGYPKDVHGWNFIANTPDVQDDNGHGSHVSGIIAATADNNYGVAGVDLAAQIMPLKFLDANGNGTTSDAISAVYYAVNHGAKVINASWGGEDFSAALQDAISYANAHNVVFVTASGNEGADNDVTTSYPASYREPNELSVAAVDINGSLPSFSNYGASTVDLAAPGVDIISDVPTSIDPSGLQDLSGTSMSTAYVSGVAAMVSGYDPSLSASQIVRRLDTTTKALPSLAGKTISGGMVDAYNALTDTTAQTTTTTTSPTPTNISSPTIVPGSTTRAVVQAAILSSDEYFNDHGATGLGFITGLYEDVLAREPDASGLAHWAQVYDSGNVSRYELAESFETSLEGWLNEVAHWYQQDLGRTESLGDLEADPGVNGWARQLVAGTGDEAVHAAILASPESIDDHGGTSDSFVQALYETLLDRDADPSGLAVWTGLLSRGASVEAVALAIEGSAEAGDTLVASWYIDDLGRAESVDQLKADPGVQGWSADLSHG